MNIKENKNFTKPANMKNSVYIPEFEDGLYSASDIETDFYGSEVKEVFFKERARYVNSWERYFNDMCVLCYSFDPGKFKNIVSDNSIHKESVKKDGKRFNPVISSNPNQVIDSIQIGLTDYYSEGNLNHETARKYAKQLLDMYGLTDRILIFVMNKKY